MLEYMTLAQGPYRSLTKRPSFAPPSNLSITTSINDLPTAPQHYNSARRRPQVSPSSHRVRTYWRSAWPIGHSVGQTTLHVQHLCSRFPTCTLPRRSRTISQAHYPHLLTRGQLHTSNPSTWSRWRPRRQPHLVVSRFGTPPLCTSCVHQQYLSPNS